FNNQIKIVWKEFGSAPRIIRIERDAQKATYTYNANGTLIKAIGMNGVPYEYKYDDEFNMTRISYRDGTYKAMSYNKVRDWVTEFRDQSGLTTGYTYISDNLDPENKFGTVVTQSQEGSKDKATSRFWYEFRKRADGTRYN